MKTYTDAEVLAAMSRTKPGTQLTIREWLPIFAHMLPEADPEALVKSITRLGSRHVLAVTPRRYGVKTVEKMEVEL